MNVKIFSELDGWTPGPPYATIDRLGHVFAINAIIWLAGNGPVAIQENVSDRLYILVLSRFVPLTFF